MFTLLMPQPAALITTETKKTLVIADPHLGWELALQEKGIHVPSQTPKLLKKLVWSVSLKRILLIRGGLHSCRLARPAERILSATSG